MAYTRREFIRNSSMAAIALRSASARAAFAQSSAVAPSDTVRFALIGSGVRGCQHLQTSLLVPGVECVAVSDLYDDRLAAAREYLNKDVPTFRDYRSVLDRKDVDAVIIAATDHQHSRLVQDACAAGKDVYC